MRESTYHGAGMVDASGERRLLVVRRENVFYGSRGDHFIKVGVRDSCRLLGPDRSFQHVEELRDARFFPLCGIALAAKQSGIELFDE